MNNWLDFMKRWKKVIPDIEDTFAFMGLAMAGFGLWQKYDWFAFIVVGFILFALGLIRSFR
jgi:hypothetical protein